MSVPLFVTMSGISGSGKSSLALQLASKFAVPNLISSDLLRAALDARTGQNPMRFPPRVLELWEGIGNVQNAETVWAGLNVESHAVCGRLDWIMKFARARGHRVIAEGFHIVPSVFDEVIRGPSVRIALVGMTREVLLQRQISRAVDTHEGSYGIREMNVVELVLQLDAMFHQDAVRSGWRLIDATLPPQEMFDLACRHIEEAVAANYS